MCIYIFINRIVLREKTDGSFPCNQGCGHCYGDTSGISIFKEPYTSAKEPYISAKEPRTSTKAPCTSTKEPYTFAKEPYT